MRFVCDSCGTDVVRAGEENEEENDGDDANASSSATNNGIAKESKQALKLKLKKFSDQIAGVERQIAKCYDIGAFDWTRIRDREKRTKKPKKLPPRVNLVAKGTGVHQGVLSREHSVEQRLEETTFEIQIGGENGENGEKSNQGIDGQEEMPEWITRVTDREEGKKQKFGRLKKTMAVHRSLER